MGSSMTPPFPTLHTEANRHAAERATAARDLAERAAEWLSQLDDTLQLSSAAGHRSPRRRRC